MSASDESQKRQALPADTCRDPVFEASLKKVKPAKGEMRAEIEKYFRGKYERLKAFLRQAIDRKESVQCSL